MLPRIGKYTKYAVITAAVICLRSLYISVFGDVRGYGSSHEYFESHRDEFKRSRLLTLPRYIYGNASVSSANSTRYPPPERKAARTLRELDSQLTGNASQIFTPYLNLLLNGSSGSCGRVARGEEPPTRPAPGAPCVPLWQRHLPEITAKSRDGRPYYLTEVLQVRIYEADKARWSVAEVKQWLHFLFLAGVEHVFICDHYNNRSEMLDAPLRRYIDLGLVTYIPWGEERHPMTAQIRCYQHVIDKYKSRCQWQLAIDMDEYPWSPRDNEEGFLVRYVRAMSQRFGNFLTEISMPNFLMLGQGDRRRDMVIDRINRMTPRPANVLVKPIYRPQRVRANVHHNHIISGRPVNANANELRMLHYWGARVQDWGPDTQRTLDISVEMNEVRDNWAPQVRNSLLAFDEESAFNKSSGP